MAAPPPSMMMGRLGSDFPVTFGTLIHAQVVQNQSSVGMASRAGFKQYV